VASGIVLRLLGPVEVLINDTWSTPRKPQQRLVIAMLALRAGQVVPVDELIDAVWEEDPPRSARGSLQVLMTRMRQTLARVPGCRLERYGDGYRLQMEPGRVDVHVFRSLAKAGRSAADGRAAVAAFDQALALWRGPALAIRGLLSALQVPSAKIPETLDAQAALYCSTLAGKRMLILLDNVRDEGQVRPLLPGGTACPVLITSRSLSRTLVYLGAAHRALGRLAAARQTWRQALAILEELHHPEAAQVRSLLDGLPVPRSETPRRRHVAHAGS
jgi:hypothetical protein